jgi:glycosyltransferase involved in cell wall biosynthesis
MLQQANVILAVSNFTKARLVDRFRIDGAKIAVVGNGVEQEYFRAFHTDPLACRSEIPQPYVLLVGGLRKKKGATDILRFAQALEALDASVAVLVVGPTDQEFRGAAGACRNLRILDRGFPDEQMARLVRGASVAVSLSSYEGFGIPLLEAMAAGVPVVAANRTAFPEVVGDAGFLVDPADCNEIAALVRDLINDHGMRTEYIARGRKRADGYRWSACAARAAGAMQAYDRRRHSI